MGKPPGLSERMKSLESNIGHGEEGEFNLSYGVTNFTPPSVLLESINDFPTLPNTSGAYGDVPVTDDIHKYNDESGLPQLKEHIRRLWLNNDRFPRQITGEEANGDNLNVVITCGGQSAIYIAMGTLLNNDEKALLFSPYYPYHKQAASLVTGNPEAPHVIQTDPEDGFTPRLSEVRTAVKENNVKAIVLCSPSNPTGTMYDESFLKGIAALCREHDDLGVIADETYSFLTYGDKKHHSIGALPGMQDRCITIGTFSKLLGITGWRLGFMVVPDHLYEDGAKRLNDNINIHPPTVTQAVLTEALQRIDGFDHVDQWMTILQSRRDTIIEPFKRSDKTKVPEPDGAYYLLPKVKRDVYDDPNDPESLPGYEEADGQIAGDRNPTVGECLKYHLLDRAGVQVMHGAPFGDAADTNIRVAYGDSTRTELEQAAEGISAALADF